MYKLEFGIVHRGCVVNELSRALPDLRIVCPGGFVLPSNAADEVVVIDDAGDDDVQAVLDHLNSSPSIAEAHLLERAPDKAFIRIVSEGGPETGYCSEAVARNRGFRLVYELQHGGVENWKVGCLERSQAEQLVKDLQSMGELKYHHISEASWNALLDEGGV